MLNARRTSLLTLSIELGRGILQGLHRLSEISLRAETDAWSAFLEARRIRLFDHVLSDWVGYFLLRLDGQLEIMLSAN